MELRTAALPLLLLFAVAAACSESRLPTEPDDPPETGGNAYLSGRVIDYASGAAWVDGEVRERTGRESALRAPIGDDGTFRIGPFESGKVHLSFVRDELSGHADVYLFNGEYQREIAISSCPQVLKGLIRDGRTGVGIVGATVKLFNQETITALDGYYELTFACDYHPGSTVNFVVTHPQYETSSIMGRMSGYYDLEIYDVLLSRR